MEMTDGEIRTYYRQLKGYTSKKIRILAELNDCTKNKICKIVGLKKTYKEEKNTGIFD
jgi:hypothetical protein